MQYPTLKDHPIIYFGNHCLQNDVFQSLKLVDSAGQNFNTFFSPVARLDGGVITNVNKAEILLNLDCGVSPLSEDILLHRNNVEEFKRRLDYSQRFLRVMQKGSYDFVFAPTSDNLTEVTLTNATNKEARQDSVQLLKHTHNFTANNSSTITYEVTFPSIDLSAKLNTNNVLNLPQWEVMVNIPKIEILESIDVKIGTDSSNYYEKTEIVANYEGKVLEQGKNILNIPHFLPDRTVSATLNVTETGTVNDASIGYLSITFNLSENDSTENYGVDGCIFSEDSKIRNFVSTPSGNVDIPNDFINLVSTFPSLTFICSDAYSQGTQREIIINDTNNTDLITDYNVFFHGNKLQLPRFELNLNTITNLSNLEILNVVKNQALRFNEGSESWAVNDSVVFDSQTKEITRNTQPQETTIGRLPTFDQGNQKIQFRVIQSNDAVINTNTNNVDSQTISQLSYTGPGEIAQSFVCTQTGTLSAVKVRIGNSDNINNAILAHIYTDSGGEPSYSQVAFSSNAFTGGLPPQDFTFNFNFPVTNGTTYWIGFTKSFGTFSTNLTITGSSSSTYASGESKVRNSSRDWVNNTTLADLQAEITISLPPSTDIDFKTSYIRTYQ